MNTESSGLKNVAIMNAAISQLTDLDEPWLFDHVADESLYRGQEEKLKK